MSRQTPIAISDDDEPMNAAPAPAFVPPKADADEVVDLVDSQPETDTDADQDSKGDATEPAAKDVVSDAADSEDADSDDADYPDDADADANSSQDSIDSFVVPDNDEVHRALKTDSKEAIASESDSSQQTFAQRQFDDDSQANRDPNADPDASTQSQVHGPAPDAPVLVASPAIAVGAADADAKAEVEDEEDEEKSDLGSDSDDDEDEGGASQLDDKVDDSSRDEIPKVDMTMLTDLSKANRSLGPAIPEEVHDDRAHPCDRSLALKRYRDVLYAYQLQLRKIAINVYKKDTDAKVKAGDIGLSTEIVAVRPSNVSKFEQKLLPVLEKNEYFATWLVFYNAFSAKIKVAEDLMTRAEAEARASHKALAGGALDDTEGIIMWLKQYEPYIGDHFPESEKAVTKTLQLFAQFEAKKADWKTFDDGFADKQGSAIQSAVPDTRVLEDDVLRAITSCQYAALVQRTLYYTLLNKCRAEFRLLSLMVALCDPSKGVGLDRYAVYDPATQLEEATLFQLILRSARVVGAPFSELRTAISRALFDGDEPADDATAFWNHQDLPKRQYGKCRVIDIVLHVVAEHRPVFREAIEECGGCTQLCVSTLEDENKDALRVQFPNANLTPEAATLAMGLKRQRWSYLRSEKWTDERFALFLPAFHAVRKGIAGWPLYCDRKDLDSVTAACQSMTAFVRRRIDYARKGVIRSKLDLPVMERDFCHLVKVWRALSNPVTSATCGLRAPQVVEELFDIRMNIAEAKDEKARSKREREMTAEDLAAEKQIEVGARQSALLEKNQQWQSHHAHFAMADADLNRDLRIVKASGLGGGADFSITNRQLYEQIIERRNRAKRRAGMLEDADTAAAGGDSGVDAVDQAMANSLLAMSEDGDRPRPAKRMRRLFG